MLPENVDVIELGPLARDVPFTESVQVPPLRVQLPSNVVPALKLAVPASNGAFPLKPAGVPPLTVAVKVVDWAEVMDAGAALSVVVLVNALFQFVNRLFTFRVPMPVTSSYPGVEGNATVSDAAPVRDNIP